MIKIFCSIDRLSKRLINQLIEFDGVVQINRIVRINEIVQINRLIKIKSRSIIRLINSLRSSQNTRKNWYAKY